MTQDTRGVLRKIGDRPVGFAVTFVLLFALTVGFLAMVDALPEGDGAQMQQSQETETRNEPMQTASRPEQPVRVVAEEIGLDTTISNPTSLDVDTLDAELTKGAVRYPTSALLGTKGTVFLFGHSSHLPVVRNQAYKAFNNIENFENGDTISVYSAGSEYRYEVTSVRRADAEEDWVELRSDGEYLVLVTCDTFRTKSDRFMVNAKLVGTYPSGN